MQTSAYSHLTLTVVVFIFVALILSTPLMAKGFEVVIMVNGPWAYVADPAWSDRLIVIAPQSSDHAPAVIFSGGDATAFLYKTSVLTGRYDIDISNLDLASCPSKPSSVNTYKIKNVDVQTLVVPAVNGTKSPRYAFSLPAPCFVTTEPGYNRRAKIDPQKDPDDTTGEGPYSIWSVFHYYVKSIDSVTLKGTSDDKSVTYNNSLKFTNNAGKRNDWGISIVLYTTKPDTDLRCDSSSAASVWNASNLFGQNLYIRMPVLDGLGNQTANYDYTCPKHLAAAAHLVHNANRVLNDITGVQSFIDSRSIPLLKAKQAFERIQGILFPLDTDLPDDVKSELAKVDEYLRRADMIKKQKTEIKDDQPTLRRTKEYVGPFVAGAGDCRGAQLDINAAIQ